MDNNDLFGSLQERQTRPGRTPEEDTCRLARQTRDFQAQILANIQDAVVVVDENDSIAYFNKAFTNLFGWNEEELLGKPVQVFVQNYISEPYKEAVYSLPDPCREDTGTVGEDLLHVECLAKNGKSLMVEISRAVWRGTEGEYKGLIASIRDITKRHQIELALQESERKYRELVQHAPTAICQLDLEQRRFTAVNDVMCEGLGYSREELLQMDLLSILDEHGAEQLQSRIRQYLNGENPDQDVVYLVKTKAGD